MVEIDEIIEVEKGKIQGWVEFRDGFEILLEYCDKVTLQDITKKATKTVWIKHVQTEVLDEDKMIRGISEYIVDWRGLKKEVAENILPLKDEATFNEIECNGAWKKVLLEHAYGFAEFVTEAITNLEQLRKGQKEAELKNSGALSL